MLTDLIKQAGVVGAGGAGFPTHIKLNVSEVEYFIVNAAECEPLIEIDKFFCRNFAEEIVEAVNRVGEHIKAEKMVIALKKNYVCEIEALDNAIKATDSHIQLFLMDSFYPAGDEQVLVDLVCGRSVPERGIPIDVGAVVNNVGTVLNIYNALKGIPVFEKYLSITGEVKKATIVKVPIGTPVVECIETARPNIDKYNILVGGPMMGKVFTTEEEITTKYITKTTGNITVLPKGHYLETRESRPISNMKKLAQSSCLQCRFCTDSCPRYRIGHSIEPHKIMRAVFLEQMVDNNEDYLKLYGNAVNCSECGICEMYACPMCLSPRKINQYLKDVLRNKQIDVPKNKKPLARESNMYGRVPTKRLTARLGLMKYSKCRAGDEYIELNPEKVNIAFSQHIGKPAEPVKKVGESVYRGELLAAAAENSLSANIHSSIDGIVEYIDRQCAIIKRKG